MTRTAKAVAAAALACAAAAATEPEPAPADAAAPAAAQTIVTAARLLDVRAGRYIANGAVTVENGRIVAVGERPRGAPATIDLGDATLLPGLIDAHSHLMCDNTGGYAQMLLTKSQAARALMGAAHARRTLLAGFTTVRDVENEGSLFADVALRDAIAQGLVPGPRMLVATRGIAAIGQYYPFGISPDLPDFPTGAQMVSGPEEARRAVREQIAAGADLIKVYADWETPTLTPAELRTVVEEAHKAHRKVAAHAMTVDGIRNAVEAGVDSIEHGHYADRATLQLMKARGVALVPTIGQFDSMIEHAAGAGERQRLERYRAETLRPLVALARDVGVRIASGYDAAEARLHGDNVREIVALRDAGLSSLEALRAATTAAAELLGLGDEIGTLEAGRAADLVAVRGDPLADVAALRDVVFVMQAGKVVRSPGDGGAAATTGAGATP